MIITNFESSSTTNGAPLPPAGGGTRKVRFNDEKINDLSSKLRTKTTELQEIERKITKSIKRLNKEIKSEIKTISDDEKNLNTEWTTILIMSCTIIGLAWSIPFYYKRYKQNVYKLQTKRNELKILENTLSNLNIKFAQQCRLKRMEIAYLEMEIPSLEKEKSQNFAPPPKSLKLKSCIKEFDPKKIILDHSLLNQKARV